MNKVFYSVAAFVCVLPERLNQSVGYDENAGLSCVHSQRSEAIQKLGSENGFDVDITKRLPILPRTLKQSKVIFLNTTGTLFNSETGA